MAIRFDFLLAVADILCTPVTRTKAILPSKVIAADTNKDHRQYVSSFVPERHPLVSFSDRETTRRGEIANVVCLSRVDAISTSAAS
jgi:hypothetical protein